MILGHTHTHLQELASDTPGPNLTLAQVLYNRELEMVFILLNGVKGKKKRKMNMQQKLHMPTKPEILTVWPFIEQGCQPLCSYTVYSTVNALRAGLGLHTVIF